MNDKAKSLGLKNTNFVTPHGLDDPNHYTTAYELAVLTDYALNNKKFAEIVSCKTKTILINGNSKSLNNTNELLGNLNGINGVKTGFTNNAGRCLVTSCTRGNLNFISVVLGADTKKFRTEDSIKVIEYAYKTYHNMNIKEYIEESFKVWERKQVFTINKGISQELDLKLGEYQYTTYPIRIGEEDNIKIKIDCQKYFESPVEKDMKIGEMKIILEEGKEIIIDILTAEDIQKKEVKDYFLEFFSMYRQMCQK